MLLFLNEEEDWKNGMDDAFIKVLLGGPMIGMVILFGNLIINITLKIRKWCHKKINPKPKTNQFNNQMVRSSLQIEESKISQNENFSISVQSRFKIFYPTEDNRRKNLEESIKK